MVQSVSSALYKVMYVCNYIIVHMYLLYVLVDLWTVWFPKQLNN